MDVFNYDMYHYLIHIKNSRFVNETNVSKYWSSYFLYPAICELINTFSECFLGNIYCWYRNQEYSSYKLYDLIK